ncbi:alpha-amylase family glycosyl hydrolase [Microbacterium sp. zg.Y1090]|uniref:alpha-amylase family glycosyl hydrolase n=1 Tax=Microbacterium TaxID=33882 RepID=UPI00214CFE4A|nr:MULTISPECIES: alpha-amylase family glycosyl hydrolase [unclassified Microbacterium]MCR2812867.1 alpha-amylase family glycosyl hydrolase [Microbacterium sp. zg.Y1084]MCR2817330.1 alpha-amylase family glycosyl hydrolase [Microbacterium sp. zg.Y1090]WIM29182.1 alpha-amylase family glycosyl hydrolase [Microbacterium sp. zg-Y1090]
MIDEDALRAKLTPLVTRLYPEQASAVLTGLLALAERWAPVLPTAPRARPDEGTAYLITYGDAFRRSGEPPLRTLAGVLREQVGDAITDVHLLPIYPWTSDDGFGVVDHREVNPDLGSWEDVADLRADHALALDFVANHVSSASPWFRGWLARDPRFAGYFLEPGPEFDTSRVVRPRTTPLVHEYDRPDGTVARAWTTFGPDQIDVDPRTPAVLLDLTDVLLGYLARGASTVRLDAIGFLWKESGSTGIHLPQTHTVIRIWRVLVDALAPGTLLLTETNVPHSDNIRYFGDGSDEAHMVYQFALPPLVLHAFVTGRATALARWAAGIEPVSPTATWFNFLASHDGIGLRPTEGLLSDEDRELLVERTLARGGRVSMAQRPDGSSGVYELNTNFLDALVAPDSADPDGDAVARGLAAHAILLSLVGVPAIYYHSLFGSGQDAAGMAQSDIARRINREVLDADLLRDELRSSPRRAGMLDGLRKLLAARRGLPGLSPFASQVVERLDDRVVVIRRAAGTGDELVAVINVSGDHLQVPSLSGTDVLTGIRHEGLRLGPHGYAWIVTAGPGGGAAAGR